MMQLVTHCVDKHVKHGISLPIELNCMRDTFCTFEVEAPTNTKAATANKIVIRSIVESTKLVEKRKPMGYLTQHIGKKPCLNSLLRAISTEDMLGVTFTSYIANENHCPVEFVHKIYPML